MSDSLIERACDFSQCQCQPPMSCQVLPCHLPRILLDTKEPHIGSPRDLHRLSDYYLFTKIKHQNIFAFDIFSA